MGKANKRKVKNKRSLSIGTDKKGTSQKMYWEDLMDFVGKITNGILNNSAMIDQLSKEYSKEIEAEQDLKLLVNGFKLSLQDLSLSTRNTMNRHVTFENDQIVDNKKGLVDPDSEDVFTFLNIANEYIIITDKLDALSSNGYLNIFTKLKAYNQQDYQNLEKKVMSGTKEKNKILTDFKQSKELIDGTTK